MVSGEINDTTEAEAEEEDADEAPKGGKELQTIKSTIAEGDLNTSSDDADMPSRREAVAEADA